MLSKTDPYKSINVLFICNVNNWKRMELQFKTQVKDIICILIFLISYLDEAVNYIKQEFFEKKSANISSKSPKTTLNHYKIIIFSIYFIFGRVFQDTKSEQREQIS